jgi:hypothetical protein
MNLRSIPLLSGLLLAAAVALARPPRGVPMPGPSWRHRPRRRSRRRVGSATITWDELVPKDWDPMKELKGLQLGGLSDADPRAAQMLKQMREAWDNAPSNPALDGQSCASRAYVVPLEESKDGLKEFLLVPYFGACIHSPPPPANQIIHVLPQTVPKGVRSMDPVWISGTLVRGKTDSYMGAAGYRIDAKTVEPYVERPR